LAVECAEAGVLDNVIAPGTVDTPMIRAASDPAQTGRYRPSGNSPLGRVAHPDDIAAVVDFLLGPQSAYVTGITINVGWRRHGRRGPAEFIDRRKRA
jgi:NAD(P)-dependent dehydrogenase (short-subunit alcohol dehydrogenase family)